MNASNPDPFETLLRSQSLRQPPPGWRREILAAANRAQASGVEYPAPGALDIFYSRMAA